MKVEIQAIANGVDVTRMQETVAAVKENPEVGSFHSGSQPLGQWR